jgi:hypothetical protein
MTHFGRGARWGHRIKALVARDLLQHQVAVAYLRHAKSWFLLLSDQVIIERVDDGAFDVGRRKPSV